MHGHDDQEPPRTAPHDRSRPGAADARVPGRPGAELVDAGVLQEIALLADVIADVAGVGGHLSPEQVDVVLGVPPRLPEHA